MGGLITKNNITNFKWWVAVLIALITITVLVPLFLVIVVFSWVNEVLSNIEDALDNWLAKCWSSIGDWVKGK